MIWIKYQGEWGANYVAEISACSVNVPATVNPKGFSPSFDSLYEFLDFQVAQGSRICLPMQETWVPSLGQEDPMEK